MSGKAMQFQNKTMGAMFRGKEIFKPLNKDRVYSCSRSYRGHMVCLVDNEYLFTEDTIWFGADGGYSFLSTLSEDNRLSVRYSRLS